MGTLDDDIVSATAVNDNTIPENTIRVDEHAVQTKFKEMRDIPYIQHDSGKYSHKFVE